MRQNNLVGAGPDFYTPDCKDFIRLILTGNDDKAIAKYHPEVQKQIGRQKALNLFAEFRQLCGELKTVDLESMEVKFDSEGQGENIELTHLVQGTKGNCFVTTTFQLAGMKFHIVGLSIKPTDVVPGQDAAVPEPPKP